MSIHLYFKIKKMLVFETENHNNCSVGDNIIILKI